MTAVEDLNGILTPRDLVTFIDNWLQKDDYVQMSFIAAGKEVDSNTFSIRLKQQQ